MTGGSIAAIVVVVPVHDEAALLEACLTSLGTAVAAAGVRCEVRVVLDACSDGSAGIAARHPFPVIHADANAVGAARVRGIDAALSALSEVPTPRIWIANTDADSRVPANWLVAQLELAEFGADVVVGTVRPDFDDLTLSHRRLWLDTHIPGAPNGHTHGANLGLRASTYLRAGGFAEVDEHEDVRLVDACRENGAVVRATDAAEVVTSGRLFGRTPGGYAGHLRDQDRLLRRVQTSPHTRREAS
ncbi:glycosyltransferase [Microbacterium sp. zg.B48]|uniref:glycosyltransferase n=1 Tax=Microbacterium sp. zg.B48 TaxID=2969408 RepID=UPI00214CB134|nr:glycosyltransferase [Microbacterium sp. zg.B48]MCR2763136.1 glycosyltransferase [Microbacterium sp. zg.B48]